MSRVSFLTLGRLPARWFLGLLVAFSVAPLLFVAYQEARGGSRLEAVVVAAASLIGLALMAGSRLQRARVERVLASRQRHTQAILDASADAYVAMDAAGHITAWSGQATQTFGWTAEDAIGRVLSGLIIPPDLRAGHDAGVERYLATGHGPLLGTRVEVEALHRDGHRFPIELAVWEAEGEEGPVFVAFIHDITDRRRKQAELAAARDQAMEASRLKSEFVANMSHEIRTPMNGVIGMTSLLARSELTSSQREYLDTIRLSADALLHVINDILDFSKIEAGRLELDERDFDPRSVVDEVGALLAPAAHAKGVELATAVQALMPAVVRGDPGRLRQVLLNVAGNAVKFTDVGEVVIDVTIDEEGGDGLIRFEVRDTGPGIPLQDQSRLFDSFSQADASSTRRHGGTGLGLAIAKRLVELMGGQIGLRSEPGNGSTFWFTVRCHLQPGAATPVYPDLHLLQGLPVLIVEDNATNRTILEQTIAGWGMVATTAGSTDEALAALEAADAAGTRFAVALLDDQMPGRDGGELARAMRDDARFTGIHRVLLTSTSDRGNLQNGEVQRYLTKPVREAALFDCIVELVAGRDSKSSPHPGDDDQEPKVPPGSGRILLAEDNPVNQFVGQQMLEEIGYDVDVVNNGAEAVEAVRHGSYAAVLMDCQMPVMDGYQAAAAIRRAEDGTRRTPIIAMTASAMEGDADRCLAVGMDDHLPKPVRIEELQQTLRTWLSQNRSHVHHPIPP
jgi:PAS domain S-box-containing protein